MIGTTISQYRILEPLGVGSLGRSYKAWDLHLERVVALSHLAAQCLGGEEDRRLLDRELAAVAALDHPNICPLYAAGQTEDGGRFVVVGFCEGETLADRIARGPLKIAVAVDLAARIAAGLTRAHEHGIVHGCLGPHCVVVADDGQPKILDFGVRALADLTCHDGGGPLRVNRGYKAPEQLRGEAPDVRSDLWALGAILYEMVTGKRPAALESSVPVGALRPEAAELGPILNRALAPRPPDRYADADEMRRALRSLHRSGSPEKAPAGIPVAPRSVGPYRLLEHLGSGGMGIVYRAEDVRLERAVALKLLPPELTRDSVAKARFMQEARMASALDHPNVCTIYDVGETEEGQLFLAMPFYDGETLRQRIERGSLPVAEIVDIARQIAGGLAKAHQKGIVHRDIKPANLMITTEGVVKILDFGIAKLKGQATITRAGSVMGTPAYMAPEQMNGEPVDARTDLWALGAVMYEMASGRRPFPAEDAIAVRAAILCGEPEPLARVRPEAAPLARIVSWLLAKSPESRPISAEIVTADLGRLTKNEKRFPRAWLTVAAVLALVGAGAFGLYRAGPSLSLRSSPVPLSAPRRSAVAVLGFRDLSGPAAGAQWLGPALAEMLGTELAASSGIRVISGDNVARAQRALSLPAVDALDPSTLPRLYHLLGADQVVVGSYLALPKEHGRQIRLDLRILRLPEGDTRAVLVKTGSEADLFDLVTRTGTELRQVLGGKTSASEEQTALTLRPASVEATRLYTEGLTHLRFFDPAGARDLLTDAARIEPGSAVIHSALSQVWSNLGYDSRAAAEARKAVALSESLPREQRLATEARFHEAVGTWKKASDIYRSLWTFDPGNLEYGLSLVSSLARAGFNTEAMTTIAALRRLPPPASSDPRIDLEEAYVARDISDRTNLEHAVKSAEAKARASGESLVLGQALLFEGSISLFHGRPTDGLPIFQEARKIFAQAGDQWGVARATAHICLAHFRGGDFAAAEAPCQEAASISQRLENITGIALGLGNLGALYAEWGDLKRARAYLEQSQRKFSETDNTGAKDTFSFFLSTLDLSDGNLDGAQKLLEDVQAQSHQARDRSYEARALSTLGTIQALHGKLVDARELQSKALKILQEIQNPVYTAPVLADFLETLTRLGDLPGAHRRAEQGLAEMRETGPRFAVGRVMRVAARITLQSGDLPGARADGEECLRIARVTGSRTLIAEALQNLGRTALAEGDPSLAQRTLAESLHELETSGDVLRQMDVRMDLALVSLVQKRPVDAERLAHEVAAWYGARAIQDGEAQALSILGEALIEQGQSAEALKTADQVRRKMEMSEDRGLRVEIATRLARIEAAAGQPAKAMSDLEQAINEASRFGFAGASLESRLTLAKTQKANGASAEATIALRRIRQEASERGFKLIAREAAALLQ